MLELLAEHRVLVDLHVGALLGAGDRAVARRLRRLHDAGLIRCERIFAQAPAAVAITRRGLDAIESSLPAPRIDLKGYRHDIGVGWLFLAAREGAFGPAASVVSERSMRSADGRGREADWRGREGERPFGVGTGMRGPGGREQLHYPDLLIGLQGGATIAIELELSAKSARRLDGIMLGYACDGRLDAVLYLAASTRIAHAVEAAARRAGIAGLVRVQLLADGSPAGAPDAASRSAGGRSTPRREGVRPRPQQRDLTAERA